MRYFSILLLFLASCSPKPSPTPSPTPNPTPTASCCNVPDSEAPGWVVANPQPDPYNALFLMEAESEIGSVCGSVPENSLEILASHLRDKNLCASKWSDAVVILRPDGLWEEWHAVAYTTGCWTSMDRAYIGSWVGPKMECR